MLRTQSCLSFSVSLFCLCVIFPICWNWFLRIAVEIFLAFVDNPLSSLWHIIYIIYNNNFYWSKKFQYQLDQAKLELLEKYCVYKFLNVKLLRNYFILNKLNFKISQLIPFKPEKPEKAVFVVFWLCRIWVSVFFRWNSQERRQK